MAAAKAGALAQKEKEAWGRGSIMSISGGQYCIMDPNECCTICGLTHWFATSGNDMRENVVGGEASSRLYFLHVLMCAQFLKTAQRAWNTCYLVGFQKNVRQKPMVHFAWDHNFKKNKTNPPKNEFLFLIGSQI